MKIQLMRRMNKNEKSYMGHGSINLDFVPMVGYYMSEKDYYYVVDKVCFSKEGSIDLFLTKTEIASIELAVNS
jgi:hypothetical protein